MLSGDQQTEIFNQAVAAHADGEFVEAESLYRRAAEAGNRDAQFQLGGLLGDLGRDEEAIVEYEKSAEAGDAEARVLVCLHMAEIPQRREAAKVRLREIGDDGDPRAYTEFAFLESEDGADESAQRWFKEAIDAGDARGHLGLAYLLSETESEGALEHFKLASELGVPGATTEYGRELLLAGEIDASIPILEKAAELGESESQALLGSALHDAEQWDRAEAVFKKALDAGDESVLVPYGDYLVHFERYDEARELFDRALALGDPEAQEALEFLLAHLKQTQG